MVNILGKRMTAVGTGENKKKRILIKVIVAVISFALLCLIFYMILAGSKGKDVTVYFVRHGQTDTNVSMILVGCETDAHLTEEGRRQCEETGEKLSEVKFDRAYASLLSRTQDTANIVLSKNHNTTPEVSVNPLLNDTNWGDAAGLTIDEASAKYPGFSEDNYLGTIDDVNFVSPIHATTKATKVADYTKALSEIVNDAKDGDNILVAGHSTFVWLLQKYFPESFNSESSLKNASVTVLKYHDGKWELK